MALKCCGKCLADKPLSDFYKRKDGRVRSECKTCWNATTKRWSRHNPERSAFLHKMKNVERKYGLSRTHYQSLLNTQQNACAICLGQFQGLRGPKSPCVDHNHKTKKVRGLLCRHCNFAIGLLGDNAEIANQVIIYLKEAA